MKLLVISHTPHYRANGKIAGWGSTVRELDHLSGLFDELVHLAPLYAGEAPGSSLVYTAKNIRFQPLRPSGGENLAAKLGILRNYPVYAGEILKELKKADAVHVRCPANLSLLAVLLLGFTRKPAYRWVKYAGNWAPGRGEPWSYKLQRAMLKRNLHRGAVSISGAWPAQPAHIFSFRNPSLDDEEIRAGRQAAQEKNLSQPVQLLYAGRIENAKGAGRAVEIAGHLHTSGIDIQLHMIGDGAERGVLEKKVQSSGMREQIQFHGWLPKPALGKFYTRCHFLLLPSASEGWPKVLSEAMAYGAVPLASNVSSIPKILAETGAGFALDPLDIRGFVNLIKKCLEDPAVWKTASTAGVEAAVQFSYPSYLTAVRNLFEEMWAIKLSELPSLPG